MKKQKWWYALAGLLLLALGFFLLNLDPYHPLQVISSEASCRMRVDVVEPIGGEPRGYVVLFHGLAANRRIMSYLAQDLANQDLRVFAPDFPGHGKTPGPFSPQRADACGEALVKELIEKRSLLPQQTLLVGHSMGGAIAIRVSGRIAMAGVVAISPAPMGAHKGISPEMLLFSDAAPLARNSLVISSSGEPQQMRGSAEAIVREARDASDEFVVIPHATHVSVLFDSDVLREMRKWIRRSLEKGTEVVQSSQLSLAGSSGGANGGGVPSSHLPLYGFLCGLTGLSLLCVPFVGEIVGGTANDLEDEAAPISTNRILGQLIVASGIAVLVLKFWVPLKFVGVFQGDYLASFALIEGMVLLAFNAGPLTKAWQFTWSGVLAAAIGAILTVMLFGAWFEYSFYEAWLTVPKWARLLPLVIAFSPWLLAEEIFLGAHASMTRVRRAILTLAFRSIAWAVIVAALFFLHSGEILMVLLVLYFVLVSLLQRLAMDVVRRETHSPIAAAFFGAILSAGFALAIFPLA